MAPQKPKKTQNTTGAGQKEVEPDTPPLEPKWGVQGLWRGHMRRYLQVFNCGVSGCRHVAGPGFGGRRAGGRDSRGLLYLLEMAEAVEIRT
jgi:hypothetical protein